MVFRQIEGVQRKLCLAFVEFQMPITQNNQNAKVAYSAARQQYLPKLEMHIIFDSAVLFLWIYRTYSLLCV